MAQFDVHKNTGQTRATTPYVVLVQSSRFDRARRRVVVPMVLQSAVTATDPQLNPLFRVEGRNVVLNPLQIVSVPLESLGKRVGSVRRESERVISALDLLFLRAWD